MHQPAPGTSTISSSALSAMLPRVTASKQNFSASGCTDDMRPISSTTSFTQLAFSRRAVSSTICNTPSASDISCIVNFQRVGQTGIKRQYRLIEGLSCLIQPNKSAIGEQRVKRPGISEVAIGRRLYLIARHFAIDDMHGVAQAPPCRQRLANAPASLARPDDGKGLAGSQPGHGGLGFGQAG